MTQQINSCNTQESAIHKIEITKEETRAVIRFLALLEIDNSVMLNLMEKAYGDSSPCIETIRKWAKRFQQGRSDITDNQRSGRPEIENLKEKVLKKLEEQPFASARSISQDLNVSYGTIHNVLTNQLHLKHYVTKWVPHKLTRK